MLLRRLLWRDSFIRRKFYSNSDVVKKFLFKFYRVEAVTDVTVLVIEKHDFWFIFGRDEIGENIIITKLLNLA